MRFSDRLNVPFLDRVRGLFLIVAVVPALVLVDALGPVGWENAYFLILYGVVIGDINRRLNPEPERQVGPILPWNRMGAGEKLEYFFPALLVLALGLLVLLIAWIMRSGSTGSWIMVGSGLAIIGLAAGIARERWHHRWAALEA